MIHASRSLGKVIASCLAAAAVLVSSTLVVAQNPSVSPELKETTTYPLTMDKIHRLAAAAKELSEYGKSNPDLALNEKSKDNSGTLNFTETANRIDSKFPAAAAIIKKNGFSTREFLVATTTFALASMAVSLKKSGMTVPADKSEGPVVQANKDLIDKNWDEVQKLSAAMRPAGGNH